MIPEQVPQHLVDMLLEEARDLDATLIRLSCKQGAEAGGSGQVATYGSRFESQVESLGKLYPPQDGWYPSHDCRSKAVHISVQVSTCTSRVDDIVHDGVNS